MKTRILAAAAAAVTTVPLLLVAGATPALAANCSDQYSQGQARIRISPSFVQTRPGSVVTLTSRVVRGSENCGTIRVGYYLRNAGQRVFTIRDRQTSADNGLTASRQRVNTDFRYYVATNALGGTASGQGLIQARGRAL